MLIKLKDIIEDYHLKIQGVIHVGAHWGEEYCDYHKSGIKNMIFFEPIASNYRRLQLAVPHTNNIRTINVALGNHFTKIDMFVETANNGQSCSCLEPGTHLKKYPDIKFESKELVTMVRLDQIQFDRTQFNMINIDVQGYELEVFKGAVETLKHIDIIYTEINYEQVYKGCVQVEQLDSFLSTFGFKRVLTDRTPQSWGMLYI